MKRLLFACALLWAGWVCGQEVDRTAAVGDYFRRHNDPIADTPHTENTPRKFSWVQKVTAFDRDGWKCVVCGDTERLEMDHAVALMNGGPNEIHNLYALCHDCHVVKTRMDRSLKKHRVRLAREQEAAAAAP
ncbi:MAG: HNH endonuclease [Verrucomicrobiota bacterium]|jgi:5-methylcytosine-specific restriction endonuclease McrA|nr:HNH endonuclease [Verrucomicrobiota bacterium]